MKKTILKEPQKNTEKCKNFGTLTSYGFSPSIHSLHVHCSPVCWPNVPCWFRRPGIHFEAA